MSGKKIILIHSGPCVYVMKIYDIHLIYSLMVHVGEARKAHIPKHDLTPRSVTFKTNKDIVENIENHFQSIKGGETTINHDELLARLNELEKEEQEEEEREHMETMKDVYEGKYIEHSVDNGRIIPRRSTLDDNALECNKRHVQFESDVSGHLNDLPDDDEANFIAFQHTTQVQVIPFFRYC